VAANRCVNKGFRVLWARISTTIATFSGERH